MSPPIRHIGIATPQANPTVEYEFQRFLSDPARGVFTRLISSSSSVEQRLTDYIEQLPDAIRSYDSLRLSAFAFACTGSSYLVGEAREEEISNQAMQQFRIPVVTATQAIRRELQGRGASRVAMLAPYPTALCDAATAYWHRLGVEVVAIKQLDVRNDTRNIYSLSDADVVSSLADFDTNGADVVLLSGTGMPSIAALQQSNTPMLSSNLCLATEVLRHSQLWPPTEAADITKLCKD